MADDSPPEKRMRYSSRSLAKASNSLEAAEKAESKPKESRYTLRSTAKRNAIAIEPSEPPRKRKKRQNTPKQLMDLNDDCLLKMLEYMSVDDLCNLAETNQRLHGLAQYQFSHKHKDFFTIWLMNGHNERIKLEKFERVLRIFGHHIVSLNVSTSDFVKDANISTNLLLLISRYCGLNLKALKLAYFTIGRLIDARYHEMFDRIEYLQLKFCWIDWFSMKSLKTLILFKVDSDWSFVSLPKIKSVTLYVLEHFKTENLVEFLTLNRRMKQLLIVQNIALSNVVCKAVGEMNDLQKLELQCYDMISDEMFQSNLNYLSSLKKLAFLTLNCMHRSVSSLLNKFVANGVGLAVLELINGSLDTDTFENIKKFKTLQALMLNRINDITNSHIIGFAEELLSLKVFRIRGNNQITGIAIRALVRNIHQLKYLKIDTPHFKLDLDTYHGMIDAIQKRTDKKHVKLTICNREQMIVPEDVINGPNKKWLCVDEKPWYP